MCTDIADIAITVAETEIINSNCSSPGFPYRVQYYYWSLLKLVLTLYVVKKLQLMGHIKDQERTNRKMLLESKSQSNTTCGLH